jgi:purine-binding chemotaxis protein CheW
MGRMADARRRARQKAEPGGRARPSAPDVEPQNREEAESSSGDRSSMEEEAAPLESSGSESFVFPDESSPYAEPRARIELPSSGLAEDILSRVEAAAVESLPMFSEPGPLVGPRRAEASSLEASTQDGAARAHNISFFAPSAREEKKAAELTEHLVTFLLGLEEYGIDVRAVQEIIRATEITPVPRAPEFIKGVINLRGRIIPVVDLKRKLGLGEVAPGRRIRIVVVKVRDRLIGLLVDGASQVLKIPVATIDPAPEEVVEIDANYIRGVAKLESRLVILMDLQRVLALELREAEGSQA